MIDRAITHQPQKGLTGSWADNILFPEQVLGTNPCYNIGIMAEKNNGSRGSEFWQIFLPALIGLILIGLSGAWIVIQVSPANVTRFAEISTVLLVIPVILVSLSSFLILGLLIYLVQRLMGIIPPFTGRILEFLEKIRGAVVDISDKVVRPVIQPFSLITGIRNLFLRKGMRYRVE